MINGELLDRLARRHRFSPRTLQIAARLLIEGASAREVAREFGIHLSRVYAVRRQVLDAAEPHLRPPRRPAPAATTIPAVGSGGRSAGRSAPSRSD